MTYLFSLVIVLIVVGAVLYIIGLIPMDSTIKRIIQVVVIVAVLIYLVELLLSLPWPPRALPRAAAAPASGLALRARR